MLGDAAGHGVKACMSIMTMHTLVRMMRRHEYRDTAHFVAEINDPNQLASDIMAYLEEQKIKLFGNVRCRAVDYTKGDHDKFILKMAVRYGG